MPCVPELLGGNLAPLPADKSDWHIHQFVRVHIPSDMRLGKECKMSLMLTLVSALLHAFTYATRVPLMQSMLLVCRDPQADIASTSTSDRFQYGTVPTVPQVCAGCLTA